MTAAHTYLAFDYGLKHIGVAIGQSLTGDARPLPALKARDGVPRWPEIETLLAEWQPSAVIVGIPLNMDDSDSEMSRRARKFLRRLEGRFGVTGYGHDERLSSFEAKERARADGHRGDFGAAPIDSEAAALILQSWLAQSSACVDDSEDSTH